MKTFGFLLLGMFALLASLAVACGDDEAPEAAGNDGGSQVAPGGGMVARDVFLVYEGQRYELVNLLMPEMVAAANFQPVGQATQADVDLRGDARVFVRDGESGTVYTYSAPTTDDGAHWLAWRLVG